MKIYTYAQACQKLTEVLDRSKYEPVLIRRRGGEAFRVTPQDPAGSPFEVAGVRTRATTADILRAVRQGRRGLRGTGLTQRRGGSRRTTRS
jgi:hypothetical protein